MSERDRAIGDLFVRALTRPGNLLPAVGVAAVGIATGIWPLYLVAAGVYGALAATTFFSTDEARKVLAARRGARPAGIAASADAPTLTDPRLRGHYRAARSEEEHIRAAIAAAPIPLPEVEVELVGLVADVGRLCARAQSIVDYLTTVDENALRSERSRAESRIAGADEGMAATLHGTVEALTEQIDAVDAMNTELGRLDARLGQVQSNLGAIRAQVVRLNVESQPDASARVLEQVASARELVGGITRGLDTAATDAVRHEKGADG